MTATAEPTARVVSRSTNSAVIAVAGEIDLSNAGQLRACLTECLVGGCRDIVVDLEELSFVDSSGLAVLAFAIKQLGARRGWLVLAKPSSAVRKALEISGLAAASVVVESEPP